jgi:hypothetical protein
LLSLLIAEIKKVGRPTKGQNCQNVMKLSCQTGVQIM